METETSPRRSKPTGEPVTIDLAAEDVTREASVSDTVAHEAAQETATPDDASASPESVRSDATEGASSAEADVAEPILAGSETNPEKKPTSVTALVAAGIIGGLVALAGAGSMQYAGYLAPLSQNGSGSSTALSGEVDALKQQIASLKVGTDEPGTAALDQRIAALEASAGQQPAGTQTVAVSDLEAKLAAMAGTVDDLKAALAQASQNQTASEGTIISRLDAAEKKINEPRNDVEVARAIASAALKSAVDRGGPFLGELDTLAGIAPQDADVASLRAFASAGVLSRADLARQFPPVANAMLDAINQTDGKGFTDRLLSSAMSLVKVRPVGNVPGENPEAIVARIEEKLKNGDLKGASLEWDSMPEAARTAGASFKSSLDDRLRVEELVGATMARAVSPTGGQG